MATALLREIADKITPQLGGIDWAALETRLGMSRDQVVYHTNAALDSTQVGLFMYQLPIKAAYDRAELAMKDVVLSWGVSDDPHTRASEITQAMNGWKAVQKDLGDISGPVLAALNNNFTFLGSQDALNMEREQYRAVISSTYMACLYGALVHAKAIMQFNDMDPRLIVSSAESITRGFNALAVLAENGAMDSLKLSAIQAPAPVPNPPSASGLGLAPIAWAAIITVGATFLVAVIAWLVVEMERQTAVNKLVKDICDDAIKTGDPAKYTHCVELAKINAAAVTTPPNPGDWLMGAGKAALMIGVAWLVIWSTPTIVKMVSNKFDLEHDAA